MNRALEGAKVGDTIIVQPEYSSGVPVLYVIERLTATQAVCKHASFKLDNGLKIGSGSGWHSKRGILGTDEGIAAARVLIRARNAQESIGRIRVTAENLEAAEAFIAASQPKASKP